MANRTKTEVEAPATVGTLSESLEDYLEIILQLQQQKRVARVRDIAARKKVSNASVSNALSRLARDGYVQHEAHEFVELTDRGADLARRVLRRHEFLERFLRDILLVSPERAEADACAIEHHVSAETLERLATFYQFVCSCPHVGASLRDGFRNCCSNTSPSSGTEPTHCANAPISTGVDSCGALDQNVVPLSTLHPGDSGVIVRLTAPSEVRARLTDAGLLPSVHVEVRRAGTADRGLELSVQGCSMEMNTGEASTVLVRRTPGDQT